MASTAVTSLGKVTMYKASVTSFDNYGQPTLGTPAAFTGMIEVARDWNQSGIETTDTINHRIYTNTEVKMDEAIWPPWLNSGSDAPRYPKSVSIFYKPGTSTVSHYEVIL